MPAVPARRTPLRTASGTHPPAGRVMRLPRHGCAVWSARSPTTMKADERLNEGLPGSKQHRSGRPPPSGGSATGERTWKCLYYAVLRPSEAVMLRENDLHLRTKERGRIDLAASASRAGTNRPRHRPPGARAEAPRRRRDKDHPHPARQQCVYGHAPAHRLASSVPITKANGLQRTGSPALPDSVLQGERPVCSHEGAPARRADH